MRRCVAFTPRQMFDLVADVEKYPEFLPLCEGLTVHSREDCGSKLHLVATMEVGYKAIREAFTTNVEVIPDDLAIDVTYQDGPFRYLVNRWRFYPANSGCEVHFFIDYAFRSAMLGMVVGAVFDRAFRKFSDAFEERARQVYGAQTSLVAGHD